MKEDLLKSFNKVDNEKLQKKFLMYTGYGYAQDAQKAVFKFKNSNHDLQLALISFISDSTPVDVMPFLDSNTKTKFQERAFEGVRFLVETLHAPINPYPEGHYHPFFPEEYSALFSAISVQNKAVVQYLIEQGADLTLTFKGQSALDFAKEVDNEEIIKLLDSKQEKLKSQKEIRVPPVSFSAKEPSATLSKKQDEVTPKIKSHKKGTDPNY